MIGQDIAEALRGLQREAESLMGESCTVVRPTGVTSNPQTGAPVVTSQPVYAGRCKLQTSGLQARSVESGSSTAVIQQSEVHLPVGTGPYKVGDVVTVGARRFRVQGVPTKTWQTAQRLPVGELL